MNETSFLEWLKGVLDASKHPALSDVQLDEDKLCVEIMGPDGRTYGFTLLADTYDPVEG